MTDIMPSPDASDTRKTLLTIEDGIATLTINAPKRLNALSPEVLDGLNEALDQVAADDTARVFVITGMGRAFCAGADLSGDAPKDQTPEERGEASRQAMHNSINPVIKKIANLNMPTISAVNGVAAGGGYGLALASDLVIAAQSAKFVLVFTPQLGLIPDLGASWHAPRLMGRAKAIGAAFFGDRMSAQQAVDNGLIWRCVPDDEFAGEVEKVAKTLAVGPTKAYREVRRAFDIAYDQSLSDHLDYEAEKQTPLIASDDFAEGVRAFMQKRKPEFKGK